MNPLPLEPVTFVATLTPAGRGAIATIAVVGPRACEFVNRRFAAVSGRPLHENSRGKIALGTFRSATSAEELVVGLPQPERVEVHCHGGAAAVEAIVAALLAEGCQRTTWQQLARTQEADEFRAEARIALAEARTTRTAAILLAQYHGALSTAIASIREQIEKGQSDEARAQIDELLARAEFGQHLTRPWQVVLAGRPNVGKSSLINALVGYQRSIVFDQPGTTRDVVTATTAIDGWPLELADTAGLRESGDAIEQAGVSRARAQIEQADLVLLVFESPAAWTPEAARLVDQLPREKRRLIIYNKCDLAAPVADGRPAGLAISATTSAGLAPLIAAISHALVPQSPPATAAVPFTMPQTEMLHSLRELARPFPA